MDFNLSLISREEARELIGVDEESPFDELQDALEMQCFPLRDYFLRNPVIIPLYRSRIRKLIQLAEAGFSLKLLSDADTALKQNAVVQQFHSSSIAELIRSYEAMRGQILLKMSQGLNPLHIAQKAEELCKLEENYMNEFLALSAELEASDEVVKASERPDPGDFLYALENDKLRGDEMIGKEKKRIMQLLKLEQ